MSPYRLCYYAPGPVAVYSIVGMAGEPTPKVLIIKYSQLACLECCWSCEAVKIVFRFMGSLFVLVYVVVLVSYSKGGSHLHIHTHTHVAELLRDRVRTSGVKSWFNLQQPSPRKISSSREDIYLSYYLKVGDPIKCTPSESARGGLCIRAYCRHIVAEW